MLWQRVSKWMDVIVDSEVCGYESMWVRKYVGTKVKLYGALTVCCCVSPDLWPPKQSTYIGAGTPSFSQMFAAWRYPPRHTTPRCDSLTSKQHVQRYLPYTLQFYLFVNLQDLWKYSSWKYFINLTGQEFPLRTNLELIQILKSYNGGNAINGQKWDRLAAVKNTKKET